MTDVLDRLKAALADRYAIERELGRGGYAIVFLADDLKHRRKVAIKVLLPELASAVGPERFLREIEIAAKLSHPHILPLHDSGEADGFLFYVMPYVEGESLRERLDREEQLPLKDAMQIAREVASALGYAHDQGVLHRDIKPGNILLQAGHAVVADFGIARAVDVAGGEQVTKTGVAVGTPGYMSPEQATGESEIDARSDIYSLACVLYEMLAGEAPFTGSTPRAVIARHLLEPVPPLSKVRDVPEAVETTVARALEKAPEDRFASAGEFVEALAKGVAPRRRDSRQRFRQPTVGLLALLALGIAGGTAGWLVLRPEESGTEAPAARSLAVLPLVNMLSPDPDQAFLADGLTDLLISQLSKIGGLDVNSYTSVMRYREERPPIPEIGRELGAEFLIEGTVASDEDEVRVNIQLIEATEDRHVWAEDYRRPLTDILKLQEEVAREIAGQIQIRLDYETLKVLTGARDVDPEAVDAYVKGRLNHRSNYVGGPRLHRTAISYLSQAIDLAPDWAPPYAELADTYINADNNDSVKAYAWAGLELDPNLALAHAALGFVLFKELDWAGAEAAFRRAIEADPNSYREHYGVYLWAAGRYPEAIANFRRELERQPFSPNLPSFLANVYVCNGEPDVAIEYLQEFLELEPTAWEAPTFAVLGAAYLKKGEYERAIAEYERAMAELDGPSYRMRSYPGYVYTKMGRTEEAREILNELEQAGSAPADLYVALGEVETALHHLERAYEEGRTDYLSLLRCLHWLGVDLTEEPGLRDNPRFQDLLSKIAFPE